MADLIEVEAEQALCPYCDDGIAEPEIDGDHQYMVCLSCGGEFGYVRIEATKIEGNCAINVPESIRRSFSGEPQAPTTATPVTLGKKRT